MLSAIPPDVLHFPVHMHKYLFAYRLYPAADHTADFVYHGSFPPFPSGFRFDPPRTQLLSACALLPLIPFMEEKGCTDHHFISNSF